MRRLMIVPWLLVLWIVLWRDLSVANVASGVAVAVGVSLGLQIDWAGIQPGGHRLRPIALARFAAYFAWKLLEANLVMAKEIVTPRNRIQTGIIAVDMRGHTDLVVTITANAVSLTPGTLSVEVAGDELKTIYVHVLHLHDMARARLEVLAMAERAAAAFGSRIGVPDERESSPR